jgi:hypothetical protein
MRGLMVVAAFVAAALVSLVASPSAATAASDNANANGQCAQGIHDYLVTNSDEGTVGDAISDGFYGNEPNIVDPYAPGGPSEQDPGTQAGRVVPSQSPGPKVTDPDGTVHRGATWGEVRSDLCTGGV